MREQEIINNPENNKLLIKFHKHLLVLRNRDQATCIAYQSDVRVYMHFCAANYPNKKITVNSEIIYDFLEYLKNEDLSNATILRRMMGLGSFWDFLYRTKQISNKPETLEEMGLCIKRIDNPTITLDHNSYMKLIEELKDDLSDIY